MCYSVGQCTHELVNSSVFVTLIFVVFNRNKEMLSYCMKLISFLQYRLNNTTTFDEDLWNGNNFSNCKLADAAILDLVKVG